MFILFDIVLGLVAPRLGVCSRLGATQQRARRATDRLELAAVLFSYDACVFWSVIGVHDIFFYFFPARYLRYINLFIFTIQNSVRRNSHCSNTDLLKQELEKIRNVFQKRNTLNNGLLPRSVSLSPTRDFQLLRFCFRTTRVFFGR